MNVRNGSRYHVIRASRQGKWHNSNNETIFKENQDSFGAFRLSLLFEKLSYEQRRMAYRNAIHQVQELMKKRFAPGLSDSKDEQCRKGHTGSTLVAAFIGSFGIETITAGDSCALLFSQGQHDETIHTSWISECRPYDAHFLMDYQKGKINSDSPYAKVETIREALNNAPLVEEFIRDNRGAETRFSNPLTHVAGPNVFSLGDDATFASYTLIPQINAFNMDKTAKQNVVVLMSDGIITQYESLDGYQDQASFLNKLRQCIMVDYQDNLEIGCKKVVEMAQARYFKMTGNTYSDDASVAIVKMTPDLNPTFMLALIVCDGHGDYGADAAAFSIIFSSSCCCRSK